MPPPDPRLTTPDRATLGLPAQPAVRARTPSTLGTFGHSVGAGVHLQATTNRATTKLAAALGMPISVETGGNRAVDGSRMIVQGATQGGYMALLNNSAAARPNAPYLAPTQLVVLRWGINDIAFFGPFTATSRLRAAWQAVLEVLVSRARAGAVYDDAHASLAYSGTDWAHFTNNTDVATGNGAANTAVSGATVTISVPADFEGGTIAYSVLGGSGQTATWTTTVDGVPYASFSSTVIDAFDPGSAPYRVMGQRIQGLTPGAHTVKIAATSITGGAAFFDSWWIESNPAPLVVVCDTNLSADYSAYASPPYRPTDADVQALNMANREVAARFTDGRVITDGGESVVPRIAGFWTADKLHPNERGEALLADRLFQRVTPKLAQFGSDLLLLGTG